MNTSNSEYNWRKLASQVMDDQEVERAFMDQAWGFLRNKAGKLMNDPYRLGFEIVHKNDANTRMVGIFAFRINSELLYAPVFFLNGEIKGTDLLYRHETKTFVPLTEEWVDYLVERTSPELGSPIDKKEYNKHPRSLNLDDLAYPPGGSSKQASEAPVGSLLHKFIVEDGGLKAIEKMAQWMQNSYSFAEAVVNTFEEKDYLPEDLTIKQASTPAPSLVLFTGGLGDTAHSYLLKQAGDNSHMTAFFNKGYYLWDDRAPSDVTPVYEDKDQSIEKIGAPGVWDVLKHDGTFEEAFVAPASKAHFRENGDSYYAVRHNDPMVSDDQPRDMRVIYKNGKSRICRDVYGKFKKDQAQVLRDGDVLEDAASGSAYCLFDPDDGTLGEPFYVKSVSEKEGMKYYTVVTNSSEPFIVTRNYDAATNDPDTNFLAKDAFFIKVKVDTFKREEGRDWYSLKIENIPTSEIGSPTALETWIMSKGLRKAALFKDPEVNAYSFRLEKNKQTPYVPRVKMATFLTHKLGINASVAENMLDTSANNEYSTWYIGDPDFEKRAYPMRLLSEEDFQLGNDSDFDLPVDYPQSFELETTNDGPSEDMEQRIGDAWDPGMGMDAQDGLPAEMLMSMGPDQLAQYAQQSQAPQLFEHGVVGSLTQVFDSVAMVDKYLPEMESGLDKLGRLLFLFYWKPRDFEDAYGADDMTNLENQIMSNFKSFGELVLQLLKKSRRRQEGNVGFGN